MIRSHIFSPTHFFQTNRSCILSSSYDWRTEWIILIKTNGPQWRKMRSIHIYDNCTSGKRVLNHNKPPFGIKGVPGIYIFSYLTSKYVLFYICHSPVVTSLRMKYVVLKTDYFCSRWSHEATSQRTHHWK